MEKLKEIIALVGDSALNKDIIGSNKIGGMRSDITIDDNVVGSNYAIATQQTGKLNTSNVLIGTSFPLYID